jgi:hypothetical protein
VAVDGGRNGGHEAREYVGAGGEFGEDGALFFRDVELGVVRVGVVGGWGLGVLLLGVAAPVHLRRRG